MESGAVVAEVTDNITGITYLRILINTGLYLTVAECPRCFAFMLPAGSAHNCPDGDVFEGPVVDWSDIIQRARC